MDEQNGLSFERVTANQTELTRLEMGMTPHQLVDHLARRFHRLKGKRVRHVDAKGEYCSDPFTFQSIGLQKNVAGYIGVTPKGVIVFVAHEPGGELLPSVV